VNHRKKEKTMDGTVQMFDVGDKIRFNAIGPNHRKGIGDVEHTAEIASVDRGNVMVYVVRVRDANLNPTNQIILLGDAEMTGLEQEG
jgi:hypothetical protein